MGQSILGPNSINRKSKVKVHNRPSSSARGKIWRQEDTRAPAYIPSFSYLHCVSRKWNLVNLRCWMYVSRRSSSIHRRTHGTLKSRAPTRTDGLLKLPGRQLIHLAVCATGVWRCRLKKSGRRRCRLKESGPGQVVGSTDEHFDSWSESAATG